MTLITCDTVNNRNRATVVNALRLLLKTNRRYYPGMDNWLDKIQANDTLGVTRDIHIAKRDSIIIGVSISKHTLEKDKVCCLYVVPEFRCSGISYKLVDRVLSKCQLPPIVTLPEPRKESFSKIINHFNMRLIREIPDRYVPGITELVYEIPLP